MTTTAADYDAIKRKQRAVWGSGDYASIATLIVPIAEDLCDRARLRADERVLDVACGTGNAAIAAARRGCRVTGLDYVPALLERAAERSRTEGVEFDLVEGDAEALPFGDDEFDAVVSVVGVMFAPNQGAAARELARVCRAGGKIVLASWTPDGFIGDLFKLVGSYLPPPPNLSPPALWGTRQRLVELFSGEVRSLDTERRVFRFQAPSAAALADLFLTRYGPTLKAWEAQDDRGREAFREDFIALIARYDDDEPGSVCVASDYLEAIAVR
ncbi:MAG TPA: class I SAM-dependent methyltransferase [Solirubrobacterales bacterium]|jgi:SAM-dependent methyltransferase